MDALKNGFEFLRDQQHRFAAQDATVVRNGETLLTTTVVRARTRFEDLDSSAGRRLTSFVDDFLFRGDVGYVPKVGDRIVVAGIAYVARIYGSELWRWEDSARAQLRVHAAREAKT